MKTSHTYAQCQDKQSHGVVQQLGQYQLLESHDDIDKQVNVSGLFIFESVQSILGYKNSVVLTVYKRLYMVSSATKKAWEGALQIMMADSTFLKGQIFDQVVLHAVTYDNNNKSNSIVLCSCDI